jgi:hypothetical protein
MPYSFLLCCNSAAGAGAGTDSADTPDPDSETEVFLFFATSEHGILMQDSFPRKQPYGDMIGLNVPRLYFRNQVSAGLKRRSVMNALS